MQYSLDPVETLRHLVFLLFCSLWPVSQTCSCKWSVTTNSFLVQPRFFDPWFWWKSRCCCCSVAKSYPTLRDSMDCRPPGSSVRGISQARMLDSVAISFFTNLPDPEIKPPSSALAGRFFTTEPHQGSPLSLRPLFISSLPFMPPSLHSHLYSI